LWFELFRGVVTLDYDPMNQYAFQADGVGKYAEKAEALVRRVGAKAKQPESGVHDELSRHRRPLKDESFSLTIRADDGRTLLETRVEYMHQAFQRLIDWSIGETGYDVSAVINGPNGFYTNHRIKASEDFAWIERRPDMIDRSGVSVGCRVRVRHP
jgi:hypothetical protein